MNGTLNDVVNQALAVAKARAAGNRAGVGGRVSVSYAAVELAKKIFGALAGIKPSSSWAPAR
jgi:glutamyl-tRNA reductase